MRKTIALITAVCMAAMFAGCTSSGNGASSEDNTVTTADITESADESEPEPVKETAPDPTPLVQQPAPPLPDFTNVAKQYADGKTEIDSKLADIAGKKDHPCINITTEDEKPMMQKLQNMAVKDGPNAENAQQIINEFVKPEILKKKE